MPDNPRVGFRKTSLVDYPGKVAGVIFLPGCKLRCPWCQNRDLILGGGNSDTVAGGDSFIPLSTALEHIARRKKVLGGVVISGGEPTVHSLTGPLINRIHALGLPVKLDTNGMNPAALYELWKTNDSRPDYIALDLKLAPSRYVELLPGRNNAAGNTAVPPPENFLTEMPDGFDPAAALGESAAFIASSGIAHEYRSLALPRNYFTAGDVESLSPLVDKSPWYFRPFVPGNSLEAAWDRLEKTAPDVTELLAARARELGKNGMAGGEVRS
jgi:pyruvate formate lyase activating enzyme